MGKEGIRLFENCSPDLVLLDVRLPDMDGYKVAAILHDHTRTGIVPVVMMSGSGGAIDKAKALRAGAVDFLKKPIDNDELLARVESLMNTKAYNEHVYTDQERLKTELSGKKHQLTTTIESISRFIPREFLQLLNRKEVDEIQPGDQVQKNMAVLFSDIRSFTTLAEKMTPSQTFKFLNSYLERMDPIIWENKGFIDKYIGDSIMALFPLGAEGALKAAIGMARYLPIYNAHRLSFGYESIDVGIGLHIGEMILGVIGHAQFIQGTVISSDVNLASRLEGLTKVYGARLIVSSDIIFGLSNPSAYSYRFLDKTKVKGMESFISVFEVYDGEPERIFEQKKETQGEFEKGVYAYHANEYEAALDIFSHLYNPNYTDTAVIVYIERCKKRIALGKDFYNRADLADQ
jgi:two-component system, sensor histidine kinase ChiS